MTQDPLLRQLHQLPGWHDATEHLRERYRVHGDAAQDQADAYAKRYQHHRAAMVFDVVLSRQRRYTRVEKLTDQFAATKQGRSLGSRRAYQTTAESESPRSPTRRPPG